MSEARSGIKTGLIILLGIFVIAVGVPIALAAAGIVLGFLAHLAVLVIKVAVTLAIGYLILVGVRAMLR